MSQSLLQSRGRVGVDVGLGCIAGRPPPPGHSTGCHNSHHGSHCYPRSSRHLGDMGSRHLHYSSH